MFKSNLCEAWYFFGWMIHFELCSSSCINAIWQCKLATPEEMKDFPQANDLRNKCDASKNMEFTTCEPVEPVTCKVSRLKNGVVIHMNV